MKDLDTRAVIKAILSMLGLLAFILGYVFALIAYPGITTLAMLTFVLIAGLYGLTNAFYQYYKR